MDRQPPKVIDVNIEKILDILQRALVRPLTPEEAGLLRDACLSLAWVLDLLGVARMTVKRLQKIVFGARTEKTNKVFDQAPTPESAPPIAGAPASDDNGEPSKKETGRKKPRGHGRNGVDAYTGATKVRVPLESLNAGDACPECVEGTVYPTTRPAVVIRVTGRAPVQATVYELERLRCNLCGEIFTAEAPAEAVDEKYDATAGTVIALLKYGSGLPFHRLARLQASLGVPLPASTQWDIIHAKARTVQPAFEELIRQAAQGEVVHNDDTGSKILEFMGERARKAALEKESLEKSSDDVESKRRGMFTTGIVSLVGGLQIALFLTGRQHAGENLRDVLLRRAAELPPPIQMCDALSRNVSPALATIVANCLAHGRRNFVDVADNFPSEARHVLESLQVVYKNDAEARQQGMSPEERLAFHQTRSQPTMDELHEWLRRRIDERLVEPNSGLGQAVAYMSRHWEKLTLFLRVAGAPLDNNIAERCLKKAILHRKNSLFFKTQNGADVSDIFMSLIYTCELNGVNPFDYLTELERHAERVLEAPGDWMPWNHREALEQASPATARSAIAPPATGGEAPTGAMARS